MEPIIISVEMHNPLLVSKGYVKASKMHNYVDTYTAYPPKLTGQFKFAKKSPPKKL